MFFEFVLGSESVSPVSHPAAMPACVRDGSAGYALLLRSSVNSSISFTAVIGSYCG
jgi:hypothetical protein